MVISCSAEIDALRNNYLFNQEIAKHYPGSEWACELRKIIHESVMLVTADVALEGINSGKFLPGNIYVIQHGDDSLSADLIKMGAKPFLLTMFESPLYAGKFYDHLENYSKYFYGVSVFGADKLKNYVPIRFPSFSRKLLNDQPLNVTPIASRKFACMVFSNKYVLVDSIFNAKGFDDFIWRILKKLKSYYSGFILSKKIKLEKIHLQSYRLDILLELNKKCLIDLFGRGWLSLYRLPVRYQKLLRSSFALHSINHVEDKIKCLSNYKYNICFENVSYPDYVTEKIFDAFFAKTVPVYWGPKNIDDLIPGNTFINASKFNSMADLVDYLINIDETTYIDILNAGQIFLHSEDAKFFSFEQVAIDIKKYFYDYLSLEK